jgi:hypothetical protein
MFSKKLEFCFIIDLFPWADGHAREAAVTYMQSINLLLHRLDPLSTDADIRVVFYSGDTFMEHKDHRKGCSETGWGLTRETITELTLQADPARSCTFAPLFREEKVMRRRHRKDPRTSCETHYFWVSGSGLCADSQDRMKLADIRFENSVHLSAVGLSSAAARLTRRSLPFSSWQEEPDEIRACFEEIYDTVLFLISRFEKSPLRRSDGSGEHWLMA